MLFAINDTFVRFGKNTNNHKKQAHDALIQIPLSAHGIYKRRCLRACTADLKKKPKTISFRVKMERLSKLDSIFLQGVFAEGYFSLCKE